MTAPLRAGSRFGYSFDAIEAVEEDNCVHGCRYGARTRAERQEIGPGGSCDVLARLALGDGDTQPELREHPDGAITCLAYTPTPARPPRPHRGPRPIPGQITLPIPAEEHP